MGLEIIKQGRAGSVSVSQMLRSLVAHEGWFVPQWFAHTVVKRSRYGVLCGTREASSFGPDPLRIYSSVEAVGEAQATLRGQNVGPYSGPITGSDLFALVTPQTGTIAIDLETEGGVRIAAADIRYWRDVVTFEQALRARGVMNELLLEFDHYLVPQNVASSQFICTPTDDGLVALVFTARDELEEFMAANEIPAAQISAREVTGRQLFGWFTDMHVSGLVANIDGPLSFALGLDRCLALKRLADLAGRAG